MFSLALGVSRIDGSLPAPVYALLSGLNAATVGIIALAAVQLAHNAVTDKLTRALVFLGGAIGMLYTALWYFPVLMVSAGIITILWDYKTVQVIGKRLRLLYGKLVNIHTQNPDLEHHQHAQEEEMSVIVPHEGASGIAGNTFERSARSTMQEGSDETPTAAESGRNQQEGSSGNMDSVLYSGRSSSNRGVSSFSKKKLLPLLIFVVSFITIMVLRGVLKSPPRGFSLFSNLYLAGTIIFGGGPVVIPLLREYVVAEGWVSARDFLLGLAIIQAFPGPNFNFAVYLGALSLAGSTSLSLAGAVIGFIGIFAPGLLIMTASMTIWSRLRSRQWLKSLLRGVNAAAVGLVFTAVYKLWQIGLIDSTHENGSPLGNDPWWVTITATSFVGGAWFGLNASAAILLGGVLGMLWYAVVKA
jgi:chromate transport protein ChrA